MRLAARFSPRAAWRRPLVGAMASLVLLGSLASVNAQAQSKKSQVSRLNSAMDAGLFYQVLMGEMTWQSGDVATAYQLMLDAARKTKNEALFQRSIDIALQARAGEQALEAAQAWQLALPESTAAYRYLIELLVALGRPKEAMEPMRTLLKISSPTERAALIATTPRLLAGAPQPEAVAAELQQTLKPYLEAPETRVVSLITLGRVWMVADNPARALDLAKQAHALDRQAEGPALLALELMATQTAATDLVDSYLKERPDNLGVRLVYARGLALLQRYDEAIVQLNTVTQRQPQLAAPWLTLGALQLEMHRSKEAIVALQNHLDKLSQQPAADTPDTSVGTVSEPDQSRQQAWLLLAEAAEQLGDSASAQAWLSKVDDPKLIRDVIQRRTLILARKGKVAEARGLIRGLSDAQADERTKALMEAAMLREAKQWAEAQKLLSAANRRLPNDVDLLYEQAMLEEKLNHMAEMERLLRRVIELKPDHHHAYNALGYSLAERNTRLAEAKGLIERALSLAPGDPFITDSLAWVEYRLGNRQEAEKLLRSAFKARPDTEIGAHLGEVLWVNGNRDEAKRVFSEARKRDAQNDVLRETLTRLRVEL